MKTWKETVKLKEELKYNFNFETLIDLCDNCGLEHEEEEFRRY